MPQEQRIGTAVLEGLHSPDIPNFSGTLVLHRIDPNKPEFKISENSVNLAQRLFPDLTETQLAQGMFAFTFRQGNFDQGHKVIFRSIKDRSIYFVAYHLEEGAGDIDLWKEFSHREGE